MLGNLRYIDFDEPNDDHKMSPYKLLLLIILQSIFCIFLASIHFILYLFGMIAVTIIMPACLMVLGSTHSLTETLNPLNTTKIIKAIGWPYLVLWLFGFILGRVLTYDSSNKF